MSAKNMIVAAVITTLLSACGGNNAYQPPLPDDGTYDTMPSDTDYGSDTGSDLGGTDGDIGDDVLPTEPATGTTDPATTGFVLNGYVKDKNGKPLAGASVSIGSQTVLTDSNGKYEIKDIRDYKVFLTVSKSGYDRLSQVTVEFTQQVPSVIRDVLLALDDSDEESEEVEIGFEHEMSIGKNFKSVSAMVVEDDVIYVLGIQDRLLFDRNTVVAFSAETGEEMATFNKTGFFTHLPKDANYLKVEDGKVFVSNGENAYVFDASGDFQDKVDGANYSLIDEVEDEDRDIEYELDTSKKVKVKVDGRSKGSFTLEEMGFAKAIGLDSDGHLLVLDTTNKVVQQYTFNYDD